jgi:hypothetical protein
MNTATNGGLMFVNAMWYNVASPYGFQFESPVDVARFIDCLCLGLDGWFWALEQEELRVYAMALGRDQLYNCLSRTCADVEARLIVRTC